jgi:hypothetical protein
VGTPAVEEKEKVAVENLPVVSKAVLLFKVQNVFASPAKRKSISSIPSILTTQHQYSIMFPVCPRASFVA